MYRNELSNVIKDVITTLSQVDIDQVKAYAAIVGKSHEAGIPVEVIPQPLLIDSIRILATGTFEETKDFNGGLGGVIFRVVTLDAGAKVSRKAAGEHQVEVHLSPRDIPYDKVLDPDMQHEVGNG